MKSFSINRRRAMKVLGASTVLLGGAGGITLGSSLFADNAEAAGTGRQLVFAGWQGEDDAQAAGAFLKQSGASINASYVAGGGELLTKLKNGGVGAIDVVSQNKDYIPLSISSGFLEPLDLGKIPNAAALFPVLFQAPWTQSDGKIYAIPLAWGDSPIVWNPKKWDAAPAKYSDLANDKYKGQLVCLDDPFSVLWLFSSSLGHPDPARITQKQLDEVSKLAAAVKRNIVLVGSFGDMTDVLVRGDASMAFAAWEYMVELAAPKGVVLKSALTTGDKGFLWADAYSIPKNAPNRDLAYSFINHMIEPAANAILAVNSGSGAANERSVPLIEPKFRTQYDYSIVSGHPKSNPMAISVLPPTNPDGDIVGIAAWRKAWQEFRA